MTDYTKNNVITGLRYRLISTMSSRLVFFVTDICLSLAPKPDRELMNGPTFSMDDDVVGFIEYVVLSAKAIATMPSSLRDEQPLLARSMVSCRSPCDCFTCTNPMTN